MQVYKVIDRLGRDYSADMMCEFCGHHQVDRHGYSDAYYRFRVIPAMVCESCGKRTTDAEAGK